MGYKQDQNAFDSTYRPSTQPSPPPQSLNGPPPIPPRANSILEPPPAYTETAPTYHSQPLTGSWSAQDPRTSSTQSLIPHQSAEGNGKRTLLLIYVHGFMGNETSFQSFPAHVHNAVTEKLKESHHVHTKIYPRYKSRNKIEGARDAFSDWLGPHESPDTDVILLGHSMGGLLSAEVALLKSSSAGSSREFRHRMLGTMNFDTPFLGMHPGVIASGLGSLFKPAPDTPAMTPLDGREGSVGSSTTLGNETTPSSTPSAYSVISNASMTTLTPSESLSSSTYDLPTKDPNYDPPFVNDVRIPQRTGWSNAWHFINKHSDGLVKATRSYVTSHFEFGGCLADYKGLKNRYAKLRALDVDPSRGTSVRFVNYYTASTGRPKKVEEAPAAGTEEAQARLAKEEERGEVEEATQGLNLNNTEGETATAPRISIEQADSGNSAETRPSNEQRLNTADTSDEDVFFSDDGQVSDVSESMEHMDPNPITDDEHEHGQGNDLENLHPSENSESNASNPISPDATNIPPPPLTKAPTLPPLPAPPAPPLDFNPDPYTDKETLKLAKSDHARQTKTYQRLLKDREKAIKDRKKFLEKRERAAEKEREKEVLREEKERLKTEKEQKAEAGAGGEEQRLKGEAKRMAREAARMRGEEPQEEDLPSPNTPTPNPDAANHTPTSSSATTTPSDTKPRNPNDKTTTTKKKENNKPPRDKKFCLLPPTIGGKADETWIRVFMPGVDEVGAHCGIFFVDGGRYEWFVGDVAERVGGWVGGGDG